MIIFYYIMSNKTSPFLYDGYTMEIGQDILDIKYYFMVFIPNFSLLYVQENLSIFIWWVYNGNRTRHLGHKVLLYGLYSEFFTAVSPRKLVHFYMMGIQWKSYKTSCLDRLAQFQSCLTDGANFTLKNTYHQIIVQLQKMEKSRRIPPYCQVFLYWI